VKGQTIHQGLSDQARPPASTVAQAEEVQEALPVEEVPTAEAVEESAEDEADAEWKSIHLELGKDQEAGDVDLDRPQE
jgi:hypothetical protein